MKSIAGLVSVFPLKIWTAGHTVWNAKRDSGGSSSYARDLSSDLCFAKQTGEKEESYNVEGRLCGRQIMQEILEHVGVSLHGLSATINIVRAPIQ